MFNKMNYEGEYLLPYLNYIKDNKIVYRVYSKHPYVMQSIRRFNILQNYILNPIFDRFNINKERRKYFAAYYINGANAIINEWVKRDCKEEIEEICNIIIECVRPFDRNNEIKIKN